MATSTTNTELEAIELGNTMKSEAVSKSARPRRRVLLAASAVVLALVGAGTIVYVFAPKDKPREVHANDESTMSDTAAAIDELMHLLEDSDEYEHVTTANSTRRRSLLFQCPWERAFGDCYNRERANVVLQRSDRVSNGWNAEAGSRPGNIALHDFFASNAWTPYEFGNNGRQNGYITHFIDSCSVCRSSLYSSAVKALQAVESRPFMFRFHETAYEEFIGSREAVSDPIGGYLNSRQRYVKNGAGIGAPTELVLQTFRGGSTTTSFRTRGPGFFFYYTFESPSRGRVLVVVDSSPPDCCSTTS